ncbi:MAG: bis-aminopropyl spermidine synthase family protein [Promethearchaeota archaeon]
MSNFLEDIQKKIPLQEGIEGHRTIFREIYRAGLISLKDLSQKTLIPIPLIAKIVNKLIEAKILDRISEGILFTENGMKYIENELNFYGYGIIKCEGCNGHPMYLSPRWDYLLEILEKLFDTRPEVDTSLDQAFATAKSSLRRALLLYERGALEGKKICLLGDDDYTSVAISHLYLGFFPEEPKLIPDELMIIDLDERILNGIKDILTEFDFNVSYKKWDYKKKIPSELLHKFDSIMLDPPYTEAGLKLTLSRAVDMLKEIPGRDIFLSFANRAPDQIFKIQEIITQMGLVITEIFPRFNTYEGASVFGNLTQMIHLVTFSKTKSLVSFDENFEDNIYTGEISPTTRFYYCRNCHKTIEVGDKSNFKTIEKLKENGCPHCGSTGPFNLERKSKNNQRS